MSCERSSTTSCPAGRYTSVDHQRLALTLPDCMYHRSATLSVKTAGDNQILCIFDGIRLRPN